MGNIFPIPEWERCCATEDVHVQEPGVELGKILAALDVLGLVIRLSTAEDTAATTEGELLDQLDQEGL